MSAHLMIGGFRDGEWLEITDSKDPRVQHMPNPMCPTKPPSDDPLRDAIRAYTDDSEIYRPFYFYCRGNKTLVFVKDDIADEEVFTTLCKGYRRRRK